MRGSSRTAASNLSNISMTKVIPERLETPHSDVELVRNVLCVQGMPTGPVLGLKRLR
jgi:hypothetical protein